MTNIMRMSTLYAPTLKEDPTDAEIASHRLLLRAGMIRKTASGVYTFLPLGQRVLAKVEAIVRDEMNAIGSQEIMMPALQPAELWHESGRWDDYGPELMRLVDRHDHGFCLGPTHEELITSLVRNELRSYKQLPASLYQIQVKFRDEIRPRFGLLRSREFIMKDAYSFHANQESLQKTYDDMSGAYGRICERCGLDYRPVEADSARSAAKVTTEFMALAEAGEAELVHCTCGYAANTEAGDCLARPTIYEVDGMEKDLDAGHPHHRGPREVPRHPASSTVKALSGKDADGNLVVLFVPGDHELNEIKAERAVRVSRCSPTRRCSRSACTKARWARSGFLRRARHRRSQPAGGSPVGRRRERGGLPLRGRPPRRGLPGRPMGGSGVVKPGDSCPKCGLPLGGARGIEVAQIFQLGDKYSRAMGATFMDEDGEEKPFIMGCYGVGVSRTLAAIVEQHNDEMGIKWPLSVAPLTCASSR